jgi:hypothetical protein
MGITIMFIRVYMKVDIIIFIQLSVLTTLAFFSTLVAAESATSSFIALGDLPYNQKQRTILNEGIIPSLHKINPPFVIHFGDFKASSMPCDNNVYSDHLHFLNTLAQGPVFYTPGDNEWTDCDAVEPKKHKYSELERLKKLREILFSQPPKGASNLKWKSQQSYPENQRWVHESVLYITLHIVGTGNGRQKIFVDDRELAFKEVDLRDNANISWLTQAFSEQKQNKLSAMVIVFHGDITQTIPCKTKNCDPFIRYKKTLVNLAALTSVPILLIHGDTKPYCIQENFLGLDEVWRLNAPGDFSLIDAVRVKVTPSNDKEPFYIRSLINKLAPEICER